MSNTCHFLFNKTNRRTNFSKLIFVKKLHVSGSFSAHHQEFYTVHLALVYVMQVWWQLSSTTILDVFESVSSVDFWQPRCAHQR